MLHHLDQDETMAVVLPHGALFRGGAEAVIRRFLVEKKELAGHGDRVAGKHILRHGDSDMHSCLQEAQGK